MTKRINVTDFTARGAKEPTEVVKTLIGWVESPIVRGGQAVPNSPTEMRRRMHIMDALEDALDRIKDVEATDKGEGEGGGQLPEFILLRDDDHKLLKEIVEQTSFTSGFSRAVLMVQDRVNDAVDCLKDGTPKTPVKADGKSAKTAVEEEEEPDDVVEEPKTAEA